MLKSFNLIIVLGISFIGLCQKKEIPNYSLVENQFLFKYDGIVFDSSYSPRILIKALNKRYNPDTSDIFFAERIFIEKYATFSRKFDLQVKNHFYKYVRQYLGYIDNNGDKNIIINLIDNTNRWRTNRILGKGWKEHFVIYFSEERILKNISVRVNLSKQELFNDL